MSDFGKLNFSVAFNPTSAFPLDARSYFESLADAQAAAATADVAGSTTTAYYYGQTVVVVENSVATLYTIQPDKTLKEAGSAALGDGKSIVVEDGKIKISGFDTAEAGAQPRKKADGTVEWVKPDTTTVEGLQTAISGLESDVTQKANAADVYTKNEVDSLVSTVYRYKGSVETYADLPATGMKVGDTYNVAAADAAHGVKAGDNVAWDGSAWDVLAGTVDLSAYATKDDLSGKVDAQAAARLMTDEEAAKLEAIDAGAQVNAIDAVSTEFIISADGKRLELKTVPMSKVDGLSAALDGKIEGVKVNGVEQTPDAQKMVNIPLAAADVAGVVKSADKENGVTVGEDGTMEVGSLNINRLVQDDSDTIIFDGGNAANG